MLVEAALLGAVQALTEFLPVSSSAHLLLVPEFAGWSDPFLSGLMLSVALHLGTALALAVALWRDWWRLARGVLGRGADAAVSRRVAASIVGSTVLVGAVAFPLRDALTETRTVLVASIMLIVFGVVLAAVDRWAPARTGFDRTRLPVWLLVGVSQLIALVPGVSRSGITMTVARLLGVERHAGARFSLLLLTPIVLAIGIVELSSVAGTEAFESVAGALVIGALTAGVVGVVVIRALLWFVATRSLLVFGVYRVALGAAALAVLALQA
ncbi:MAG: undecaprenyl-diphosphate phosphatase [Chloroflexota bacterium]|nr:undecaprenyl-diphosphate phosphatase [Chloroflexota bacterium]